MVVIKRAYEPRSRDGLRVLVDRLWPRGLGRRAAAIDWWARELAPSHALRRWFGHDPRRWTEFQLRYRRKLRRQREALERLAHHAAHRRVTLLYAAKDQAHNNAAVLQRAVASLMTRARRR